MQTEKTIYERKMERSLLRFETTSLRQLDEVALLNRTDTKYVMSANTLLHALNALHDAYMVLSIDGQRNHRYRTLYFDSADFDLYRRHHAGMLNRYKVRAREYIDTERAFLEVKFKSNKQRTIKSRMATEEVVTDIARTPEAHRTADFLTDTYPAPAELLQPQLWNQFRRITLVSKRRRERLTLDFGIEFRWQQRRKRVPHVAIAEVKQEGFSHDSDFIRQMRRFGVRPRGFSKYCMGVSYLYPEIKHNNFKPTMRLLDKLGTRH